MVGLPLKSLKGGGAAFLLYFQGWGHLWSLWKGVGPPLYFISKGGAALGTNRKKAVFDTFFQINGMAIIFQKSVWDQREAIFNSILVNSFYQQFSKFSLLIGQN